MTTIPHKKINPALPAGNLLPRPPPNFIEDG